MRCRGIAMISLLLAAPAHAGDVIVNGENLGKLTGMVIDFTGDKTGKMVIKTIPPLAPTIPVPAVPLPTGVELGTSYPSLRALYDFVHAQKYPGTVVVDGIKIRSGVKAPVHFRSQSDGSVRKVP